MMDEIPLARIEDARSNIASSVRETPMIASARLSDVADAAVFLKCEHHQITGSFKLRGATNAVLNLTEQKRHAGIVGVSTGNHGRALAHAARLAGVDCTIGMSSLVPQNKVAAIKALGAEVLICGASQDEAQDAVDELVAAGKTMIPPFDNADVIAGQGTLGLEMLSQLPDLETALVPLSGGGLMSGVAIALKSRKPSVRVVGVCMERGAAMQESLIAGRPVPVEELPTLADSLGGGIGLDNRYTFATVQALVDDVVLVSETEIAEAIRHCFWTEGQVVEGGAAVGVAAILSRKIELSGATSVLLSGGNIDLDMHRRIASGENVDLMVERKAETRA